MESNFLLITFVRRLCISFEICDVTNEEEEEDPDPAFSATELAAVVAVKIQKKRYIIFFIKVPNIIMVYIFRAGPAGHALNNYSVSCPLCPVSCVLCPVSCLWKKMSRILV